MALQSFLQVSVGGEDVPAEFGEDTTLSAQGATDVSAWLECSAFEAALDAGQQGAHGSSPTGRRTWHPARFVLRVGKSTPVLFEAARRNQRIDLTLHFFHRHPDTGEIQERFQYRISQGRISSIRLTQPDVLDPTTGQRPEQVEVSVVPNVVEIESLTGSTIMVDGAPPGVRDERAAVAPGDREEGASSGVDGGDRLGSDGTPSEAAPI